MKKSDAVQCAAAAWDTSGYFQRALKDDYGPDLAVLDPKYQPCFIHYGAFSKNRNINEWNVGLYRRLQILRRRGLFGHEEGLIGNVDQLMNKSGNFLIDFVSVTSIDLNVGRAGDRDKK